MKKIYIIPLIEQVPFSPEVLAPQLISTKLKGSVETAAGASVEGTAWGFGGDSQEDDTPDAKSGNLWDGWDD